MLDIDVKWLVIHYIRILILIQTYILLCYLDELSLHIILLF